MRALYLTSVTLHVLATLYWLGGTWFFALVAAPILRREVEEPARRRVFQAIGRRFQVHGHAAFLLLVLTGLYNLYARGWLRPEVLGSGAFWGSPLGHSLAAKLVLVVVVFTLNGVHNSISRGLAGADPDTPETVRRRRLALGLARAAALLGLLLVVFAVRVARGG